MICNFTVMNKIIKTLFNVVGNATPDTRIQKLNNRTQVARFFCQFD